MDNKFNMSLQENLFLAKKLLAESIYNTAKLEGVNTTFPETEAILDGVNIPNAKLDDIQVILNLRDAWRFTLSNIENTKIDLEFIEKINENVSRNESLQWGELRTGSIGISGTNHKPKIPVKTEVENEVSSLLGSGSVSATERAINLALYIMHQQLFWDGNKRTANIAANAVLIQNGAGLLSVSIDNIAGFNKLLTEYYDTHNDKNIKKFFYNKAIINFESKNVPINAPINVPINQAVLDEIRLNPSASYDEIAETLGKNRKTIGRAITELKKSGKITRQGSKKTGFWAVN